MGVPNLVQRLTTRNHKLKMAPPSYSDLGKNAKDVFSKGYNWGFFKLDGKSKTAKGVEFKTTLNSNRDTGKVAGNLETKYKWSEYGLTFTEKWNTENVLNTEIKIEDQLADGLEFTGSVHQKVNSQLDAAVSLAWQSGSGSTTFALGAKYKLDDDASINMKVNNSSHVGLGYTQKLRDGVKLTVSSLIDGKNINAGGHKVGLGLEFEA